MININKIENGIANISDESETFNVREESIAEYSEKMTYEEYQEWVSGAIIRD